MNDRLPLAGMGIVVTRPAHQAEPLCRLIEAQGGRAIRFPTLEIRPPRDPDAALAVIDQLDACAMAIFTSANAVEHGMALLRARRALPPNLPVAAIGKATARALTRLGAPPRWIPEDAFTSEALLALPALHEVAGQHIVIFRGEGGRDLLGATLRERGATVLYAEVYRRCKPDADIDQLLQYWARGAIQAVVVTSNESLQNLFDLVGDAGRQWLRDTPLVVVSARARQLALRLGVKPPPLVAAEASDEALLATLLQLPSCSMPTTTGESP